jgi:hypothetical protein
MPTEENPIRIVLFENRPTAMLIHAHEGSKFQLPQFQAPFEKNAVSQALGLAGFTVRVSVEIGTGRWTQSIGRKMREEKQERAQNQKLKEAQQATILKHANDPLERDRARLMLHKHEVDEALRAAKVKLGAAKANFVKFRTYMDPVAYWKLEAKVEELKQESQGIQVTLGQLRKQEGEKKGSNYEIHNRRFRSFAQKVLSDDLFEELEALADSDIEPATFEPDELEEEEV